MAKNLRLLTSLSRSPQSLLSFIKEARDELKKVSWPSRETTIRYTIVVIVSSLALGGVTGGIDYLLARLLNFII